MDTPDTHTSQSNQTQGQVYEENTQQIPDQQLPRVQEESYQQIPKRQRHKLHHSYIWLSALRPALCFDSASCFYWFMPQVP